MSNVYLDSKGNRFKAMEGAAPVFGEYHGIWYLDAYRFIKSRNEFSKAGGMFNNGKEPYRMEG